MADLEEPEADASELLEFLDQVKVSINRISVEAERNLVDLEDLLLEAEALLHDVSIVPYIGYFSDSRKPSYKKISTIFIFVHV